MIAVKEEIRGQNILRTVAFIVAKVFLDLPKEKRQQKRERRIRNSEKRKRENGENRKENMGKLE